jgi:hypothetical protein
MWSGEREAERFLNCNHSGTGHAGGPSLRRHERIQMSNRMQLGVELRTKLGTELGNELGKL